MMGRAELQERIRVARIIAEDAEADAAGLDGQPFTGYAVATAMGHHLAQTHRLAVMVAELYEERLAEHELLMDQAPPLPDPGPPETITRP